MGKTSSEINKLIEGDSNMRVVLWSVDAGARKGGAPEGGTGVGDRRAKGKGTRGKGAKDTDDTLWPKGVKDIMGERVVGADADSIVKNVLDIVAVGDIVLFKEGNPQLLEALPVIIDTLHWRGFELLTVSEMLSFPDDKPH